MEHASIPWTHPHVTLAEITQSAAAFLDLLRLASGLQSSAIPFAWPPQSIHKALAWGKHLEQVMADMPESAEGLKSRAALDAALANLITSAATYPAGLPRLTAADLSNSRRLFLQALLQAVAPDSDYFESISDCLIRLEGESGIMAKEEISTRNSALRCAESLNQFVESTANCLVFEKKQITCVTTFWDCNNSAVDVADENLFEAWSRNAVEYVTSFTTVYKSAAANLIFKSSEDDWRTVLQTSRAYTSSTSVSDSAASETEIAELCCLQLAYADSKDLAFRIAASPLFTATDLCAIPEGALRIETFLIEILESQADLWWKLPPVLLAGVCKSRFSMLKTYLQTLTKAEEVCGRPCKCTCHVSSKKCHGCQQCSTAAMERLWCFAVHHPKLRTFDAHQVDSVCMYLLDEAEKKTVS